MHMAMAKHTRNPAGTSHESEPESPIAAAAARRHRVKGADCCYGDTARPSAERPARGLGLGGARPRAAPRPSADKADHATEASSRTSPKKNFGDG